MTAISLLVVKSNHAHSSVGFGLGRVTNSIPTDDVARDHPGKVPCGHPFPKDRSLDPVRINGTPNELRHVLRLKPVEREIDQMK